VDGVRSRRLPRRPGDHLAQLGEPPQSTATGCTHRRNCAVEARDNHSLGSEQTKEGRALIGRRELIDGVIAPSAAMYQNPIVRTADRSSQHLQLARRTSRAAPALCASSTACGSALKTAETTTGTIPSIRNEGMTHIMSGSTLRTPRPCSRSPRSGLPADPEVDASRRDVSRGTDLLRGQAARKPSFGVSHPCGAFDRWPAIPLVDHGHKLTGAVKHRSLIRREGSSSPTRSVIPFFQKGD
jgi:hypothetical protein